MNTTRLRANSCPTYVPTAVYNPPDGTNLTTVVRCTLPGEREDTQLAFAGARVCVCVGLTIPGSLMGRVWYAVALRNVASYLFVLDASLAHQCRLCFDLALDVHNSVLPS